MMFRGLVFGGVSGVCENWCYCLLFRPGHWLGLLSEIKLKNKYFNKLIEEESAPHQMFQLPS